MKQLVRRLLGAVGLRLVRTPPNRFDGTADALSQLVQRGFRPDVVIDGGANVGQWTSLAAAVFPRARFHLIEPQPACQPSLRALATAPRFEVHPVALSKPGVERVMLIGGDGSTGAHVAHANDPRPGTWVPAVTLDALLAGRIEASQRVLLKLDLEGYELDALAGANALLARVDVVLSEVRFYDIDHDGRPVFLELAARLAAAGFAVYDFASLSGRPRDGRLVQGDVVFIRADVPLAADVSWN